MMLTRTLTRHWTLDMDLAELDIFSFAEVLGLSIIGIMAEWSIGWGYIEFQ